MPPPPPPKPKAPATAPSAGTSTTSPPPAKPPAGRPPPTSAKPAAARVPAKTFSIAQYQASNEGQKILLYAPTGLGKTTLASMAPNVVYIAFDKNALRLTNAKTGEPVNMIPGIDNYQDLRDAMHQPGLFPDGSTLVIDTVTKAEAVAEGYIFDHYPLKQGKATHMRAYGWDGPGHTLDVMRLLLTDLEPHVTAGRNVILIAQQGQATVSNSEGVDYLQDGPRLTHTKQYSVRMEISEWCDHVLRIGFQDFEVKLDSDKARVGKAGGSQTRAVFSGGAAHYLAKSRKIGGKQLPQVISFETEADDSLWQMIFHGAIP